MLFSRDICDMDGLWLCWVKYIRARQVLYDITSTWNLKKAKLRSRVEQWFPGFGETFVEGLIPVTRWLTAGDMLSMKSAVNNAVLCVHFRAAEPGSWMFLNVLDRKRSHRTKQVIRWHDGGENSRGSDGVAMYQYQSHTLCQLNSRNINVSYIFKKKNIFLWGAESCRWLCEWASQQPILSWAFRCGPSSSQHLDWQTWGHIQTPDPQKICDRLAAASCCFGVICYLAVENWYASSWELRGTHS